jgi:hypothetical protein
LGNWVANDDVDAGGAAEVLEHGAGQKVEEWRQFIQKWNGVQLLNLVLVL